MTRTRKGFTLVELLVVIAIIGILAALIMAGVQRTRESARNTQCRADITQLETAIGQFKARFKVYPPCTGSGPNGTFRLATTYTGTEPEFLYLQSMFERISNGDNGLRRLTGGQPTPADAANIGSHGITLANAVNLDPNQCLVFFLSGGVFTGYSGFSTNPRTPFNAPNTSTGAVAGRLNNGPFFDGFSGSRMVPRNEWKSPVKASSDPNVDGFNTPFPADGRRWPADTAPAADANQPWFVDPWGSPYLYFSSNIGNDYPFANTTTSGSGSQRGLKIGPWGGDFSPNNIPEGVQPFYMATASGSNLTNQKFLNIKGFQIISAGRDRLFGPGGSSLNPTAPYNPGMGAYALSRRGGDDYSNTQQTPLGSSD